MKITEQDRQKAREERELAKQNKKPMPEAAARALGRGKCEDCDLPWDCVGVGGHVPVNGSASDWVCGRCYRIRTPEKAPVKRSRASKKARQKVWNQ